MKILQLWGFAKVLWNFYFLLCITPFVHLMPSNVNGDWIYSKKRGNSIPTATAFMTKQTQYSLCHKRHQSFGFFCVFAAPTVDWIGVLLNYSCIVWLRCHKYTAKYFLIWKPQTNCKMKSGKAKYIRKHTIFKPSKRRYYQRTI